MMRSTYNKYVKYNTNGVCCTMISYDIINGKYVKNVIFHDGCPAGLAAVAKAINGKEIKDVIKMFENMECGNRSSSCPNELAKSLKEELKLIEENPDLSISLKDFLIQSYETFLEKSKIDLNKYKVILKIKPEIKEELNDEISELVESERDIYWFKLKDVTMIIDDTIQDDFIFNSKAL